MVNCDNQAVVNVVSSGSSTDAKLMNLMRCLLFVCAQGNFSSCVSILLALITRSLTLSPVCRWTASDASHLKLRHFRRRCQPCRCTTSRLLSAQRPQRKHRAHLHVWPTSVPTVLPPAALHQQQWVTRTGIRIHRPCLRRAPGVSAASPRHDHHLSGKRTRLARHVQLCFPSGRQPSTTAAADGHGQR